MSNKNGWFYDYASGNKAQVQAEIVAGCLASGVGQIEFIQSCGSASNAAQEISNYASAQGLTLIDQDGDEYDIADFVEGYLEQSVEEAAERRVHDSDALEQHEVVLLSYEWTHRNEHVLWVATAPESEIVDWAVSIEKERE
jgi:hypothetical protein